MENTRRLIADQHYTICLPYDLPLPSTLKAYTLNGVNTAGTLIGFTEVTGTLGPTGDPDWLPIPYVVIPSATGQLLNATNTVVREFKEEVVAKEQRLNEKHVGNYYFCGTMRYIEGATANGLYIMQGKDATGVCTWKQIASDYTNTGSNPTNPCVLPMRAYISISGSAPAPPVVYSTFTGADGSTTTVSNLRLDADDNLDGQTVYDLQGRRVSQPTKGLYIVNGKKRIIK